MDSFCQTPLTPEQLAAIAAGGGWARVKDPNTDRVFLIAEEIAPKVDDDYLREKLAEAAAESERGEVAELDMEAIKLELRSRLAED